ncbi:Rha family transcriptional regulator [Limosilactobacillus fermentum]
MLKLENQEEIIKQVNDREVMDSRDVAKMIGKRHRDLMRDIRRYISDLEESAKLRSRDMEMDPKLDSSKFFIESSYVSQQGKELPCYLLTKQGCEFVANKLTGKKGTIFTATYVGLFNQYQAEHNGKAIAIDSSLEHEKLAYKREWLIEMRKQNVNKAHELRNQDVKLYLELGKVADDYQRPRMATDFRNEAIRAMQALPVGARREYSATEIGNIIGVSPIAIGKWANKLGVKRDADMSYRDHDGAWRYFPEALKVFQDNALEIQDDDLGL